MCHLVMLCIQYIERALLLLCLKGKLSHVARVHLVMLYIQYIERALLLLCLKGKLAHVAHVSIWLYCVSNI